MKLRLDVGSDFESILFKARNNCVSQGQQFSNFNRFRHPDLVWSLDEHFSWRNHFFGGRPVFPFGTGGHLRNCVRVRFPPPSYWKARNFSKSYGLYISSYFLHIFHNIFLHTSFIFLSYFFIFSTYSFIFPSYFFIFPEALEL